MAETFEKRHPITHNLGVVDKKYMQCARTAENEGKEVLVAETEVQAALDSVLALSGYVHGLLFSGI
ncbi:MAG: hypothetical protein ACYC9J_06810 [Sulfuricaulis sp.]